MHKMAVSRQGALESISPSVTISAIGLVRTGVTLTLGMEIADSPKRPKLSSRPAPRHFMTECMRSPKDSGRGGAQVAEDYIFLCVHEGTHIDALSHVGFEGELFGGHSTSSVSERGAEALGIEGFGGVATRGVFVDLADSSGAECLQPGRSISSRDLATWSEQHTGFRTGDVVYIRTGWLRHHSTMGFAFEDGEPGLGLDGARYLADRGVCVVGMDNFGIEPYGPRVDGKLREMPVHVELIQRRGVFLIEFCDFEELAKTERFEFLTILAPLAIVGGVGSPINPVVIL